MNCVWGVVNFVLKHAMVYKGSVGNVHGAQRFPHRISVNLGLKFLEKISGLGDYRAVTESLM